MTWRAVGRALRAILKDTGEDAEADAIWIACEVLGGDPARLVLAAGEACPDGMRRRALAMARERASGVPLQYILGWTPFMGLRLRCDARALIPRPETEDWAAYAVAWARGHGARTALDLGTGTGALAFALASAGLRVDAVDASEDALSLARDNAAALGAGASVVFYLGSWYQPLPEGVRYDVIVSNPPYILSGEIGGLAPPVRDHEPRIALDGGADGLDAYRVILSALPLNRGGCCWLEAGAGQAPAICAMALDAGWRAEVFPDIRGVDRVVRIRYACVKSARIP